MREFIIANFRQPTIMRD